MTMPAGMSRRACLALTAATLLPRMARAGTQAEEPLANAVRSALSAAIARAAPPKLSFDATEARLAHLRWLGAMSDRLLRRLPDPQTRVEFLQTLWYESKRAGLEPALEIGRASCRERVSVLV